MLRFVAVCSGGHGGLVRVGRGRSGKVSRSRLGTAVCVGLCWVKVCYGGHVAVRLGLIRLGWSRLGGRGHSR